MKALELKVPPIVLVVVIATCMWVTSRVSANFYFTIPGVKFLAAGMLAVGVAIAILGVWQFKRVGTTVDPRVPQQSASLVVQGIYQHSRNPMYLGFLLALAAWGLVLGSVLSLLFLLVFIIYMNRFQILPEERAMSEKFGTSFNKYKSEVRRWV